MTLMFSGSEVRKFMSAKIVAGSEKLQKHLVSQKDLCDTMSLVKAEEIVRPMFRLLVERNDGFKSAIDD